MMHSINESFIRGILSVFVNFKTISGVTGVSVKLSKSFASIQNLLVVSATSTGVLLLKLREMPIPMSETNQTPGCGAFCR